MSGHPHCSLGTCVFVSPDKKAVPVTQFVDVGAMLQDVDRHSHQAGAARVSSCSRF
ncbi:MAG: hypothetical protein AAB654_18935 [Acidobacteriota bacterium]